MQGNQVNGDNTLKQVIQLTLPPGTYMLQSSIRLVHHDRVVCGMEGGVERGGMFVGPNPSNSLGEDPLTLINAAVLPSGGTIKVVCVSDALIFQAYGWLSATKVGKLTH